MAIVVALIVLGLVVVVIVAALLVQLGCYLTGAESPSLGRAVGVVLAAMAVGFFVNLTIQSTAGLLFRWMAVEEEMLRKGGPLFWVMRGVQLVSDTLVFGAICSGLLRGVTFGRGVIIGLIVCLGAILLGFMAAFAVGAIVALQR